jgi:hypothetical protein
MGSSDEIFKDLERKSGQTSVVGAHVCVKQARILNLSYQGDCLELLSFLPCFVLEKAKNDQSGGEKHVGQWKSLR